MRATFPFTAIVGQHEMLEALRLAAIDPTLGGVLVIGDRGTGKTTAVRGLADLLPPLPSRRGCRYNCPPDRPAPACAPCNAARPPRRADRPTPVVDLPLGSSEDRVLGSIDIERALAAAEFVFEPGLLAAAHRGFLYIDEVNLLEDHIVDLLLDVAVSGECAVEREGMSVRYPSRFVLVGSGNPEEGELRPQLLDRFGLCVGVSSPSSIPERIEVVRRRDAFERDASAFAEGYARQQAAERRSLARARRALRTVETQEAVLEAIAAICIGLGIDGLRGELALLRASRARAALRRSARVEIDDVRATAPLALRHRLRRDPLDEMGSDARIERAVAVALGTATEAAKVV